MNDFPVRHVLYSHYGAYEKPDHEAFAAGTPVQNLQCVKHLEQHFRGLRELLTTPGYEGLLVLFYAPGFAEFLSGIANGRNQQQLINENESLKFASEVAQCVRSKLAVAELANRVRFITALDLQVIIGQAHAILAEKFR